MKKRYKKNRRFKFKPMKIAFLISLIIFLGAGCSERDEVDVIEQLSNEPFAAVPKNVITTIPVGNGPWGIAAAPEENLVYVSNSIDGSVSVIQTSDNSIIATIDVGDGRNDRRTGIAVSPDGRYVYVTNCVEDKLYVISTENHEVKFDIEVGKWPVNVAVMPPDPDNPGGKYVYVTNSGDDTVSVIETVTHTVVNIEITVGIEPVDLAVTPDGQYVYIVNRKANKNKDQDTVSVIQTSDNTVLENDDGTILEIQVGNSPRGIVVNEIAENEYDIFVTNKEDDTVSVIQWTDPTNITVTEIGPKLEENGYGIGNTPRGIAMLTPENDYVYIANEDGDFGHTISIIDAYTYVVIGEIKLEDDTTYPRGIAITPDGDFIYATDYKNDSVIVIGY